MLSIVVDSSLITTSHQYYYCRYIANRSRSFPEFLFNATFSLPLKNRTRVSIKHKLLSIYLLLIVVIIIIIIMKFSLFATAAIAALGNTHAHGTTDAHAEKSWVVVSDAQLPKPVSDHSSTFIPADAAAGTKAGIYIAGGCDSPNGNTYVDADGLLLDFFMCESISDDLHVFDADTMTFATSSAPLPRARYRHAAVHAQGKLWLVGGRTIPDDTIIPEVDVSTVEQSRVE